MSDDYDIRESIPEKRERLERYFQEKAIENQETREQITRDTLGIHDRLTPFYSKRWKLWQVITQEQFDIYVKKNTDYGDSFVDGIKDIGPVSFVTRVYDKVKRMISLSKQTALVESESFDDSVRDMVNYGMMYLMHRREEG